MFEGAWKWKLSAAHLFLDKLKENRFPGISEVSALVEELQDECNMASWNTRLQFPHVHKARVTRVQLGQFTQQSSPLREEVAPEDISDQREVADHAHPDYKYDFDYVVSELEQVGDREGFIAGEERDGWAGCEGRGWGAVEVGEVVKRARRYSFNVSLYRIGHTQRQICTRRSERSASRW